MKYKIAAIIFNWAGTTTDHESCGPINAFIEIFAAKSIKITSEQVRRPMGMHKIAHIKNLIETPEIQQEWVRKHKKHPQENDGLELFGMFETALEKAFYTIQN